MKDFDRRFKASLAQAIPGEPGVYRFFNEADQLIYVGKAKNLRRRLGQYRNAKRCKAQIKMRKIVRSAVRLEWTTTASELEARLLEAKLIQTHRPKWNIAGAFSFMYPFIGLTHHAQGLSIAYSTRLERLEGLEVHGAYRSREYTANAFFALQRILKLLHHPSQRKDRSSRYAQTLSARVAIRFDFRLRSAVDDSKTRAFFKGESFGWIEEMAINLLDHPTALARRDEVQEDLRTLRLFYKHEAVRLNRAIARTDYDRYPVPQSERDFVFISSRNQALYRSSAPNSRTPARESTELDF